jgi:hypothetical protein
MTTEYLSLSDDPIMVSRAVLKDVETKYGGGKTKSKSRRTTRWNLT